MTESRLIDVGQWNHHEIMDHFEIHWFQIHVTGTGKTEIEMEM